MKAQRPSKKIRFRVGKTMPWPGVLHDFDCFASVNPEYEPMRRLVYDLHSCSASELHATQTMGGNLLLSPEEGYTTTIMFCWSRIVPQNSAFISSIGPSASAMT